MVLSDREIMERSKVPDFVVEQEIFPAAIGRRAPKIEIRKEFFWGDETDVMSYVGSHNTPTALFSQQRKTYRLLTPEENDAFKPMISPFFGCQVRTREVIDNSQEAHELDDDVYKHEKIISYGLSSYGYDIRLADEFKIFTNVDSAQVDPKNFDSNAFVDRKGLFCIIPPNSFMLGRSVERICVPRDIIAVCIGKSTYARVGCIVNVTPLEPEWEGYITLELSNTTPLPMKVYANEGVAQLMFHRASRACQVSYADRKGKYQDQPAQVVPARI